ncbi:MAG: hypothetical protein IJA54_04725 [Tyzzerella sp.]|nr:hypothetical protein [Tyzzerella sp.]
MKRQYRKGLNIPMILACVLFCLTLFSIHFMGGLYAKYTAHTSASDEARVAKFDISESGAYFSEELLIEGTPGSVEREIVVNNNSEVAVAYIVTIKNTTKNIPYKFSVNGSTATLNECSVTCYLEPNSENNIIKIAAIWDEKDALNYMGMVDLVKLTISAQQVD